VSRLPGGPWIALLLGTTLAALSFWLVLTRARLMITLRGGAGSGRVILYGSARVALARRAWQRGFAFSREDIWRTLLEGPRAGSGPSWRSPEASVILDETLTAVTGGALALVEVRAVLGTGDAAETAIVCGFVNGLLGTLAAVLQSSRARARAVRAHCGPVWSEQAVWHIELRCILRPTLSQAIRAAWRVYRLHRQRQSPARGQTHPKGASPNGRSPDPRPDENRDVDPEGDGGR